MGYKQKKSKEDGNYTGPIEIYNANSTYFLIVFLYTIKVVFVVFVLAVFFRYLLKWKKNKQVHLHYQ